MKDAEIERAAQEVLAAHEIWRLPIDPFAIARHEGITLLPGSYDGQFDGRIEYRHREARGRFFLFYPDEGTGRTSGRVRFSIAHELGHFYLPEHREFLLSGTWHGSHSGFVSEKRLEREADLFAAALLMPKEALRERAERLAGGATLRDLVSLADRVFGTSITSTAIRYTQLSFEPCCVVLSRDGEILYGVSSDDLRLLGVGPLIRGRIPAASITGKLRVSQGTPPPTTKTEGSVSSAIWFGGREIQLWEDVKDLGSTGLTLTYLCLDEGDGGGNEDED